MKKDYLKDIGEYKLTGEIIINIELVKKYWNKLWYISYTNFGQKKYKLVKKLRKDSEICDLKFQISEEQALEIVKILNLYFIPSFIFKNAGTFKKEDHFS